VTVTVAVTVDVVVTVTVGPGEPDWVTVDVWVTVTVGVTAGTVVTIVFGAPPGTWVTTVRTTFGLVVTVIVRVTVGPVAGSALLPVWLWLYSQRPSPPSTISVRAATHAVTTGHWRLPCPPSL